MGIAATPPRNMSIPLSGTSFSDKVFSELRLKSCCLTIPPAKTARRRPYQIMSRSSSLKTRSSPRLLTQNRKEASCLSSRHHQLLLLHLRPPFQWLKLWRTKLGGARSGLAFFHRSQLF